MSEQLVRYEQFEYSKENPFQILNIYRRSERMDTVEEKLQHHWHAELEICFIQEGNKSKHIVDGKEIIDTQGKVIVVNSDSIHNIIDCYDDVEVGHVSATVVVISREFLLSAIPNYEKIYFLPESDDNESLAPILKELSKYGNKFDGEATIRDYDWLHIKALIYELIYKLLETRRSWRNVELPVNQAKNLERMKGVVSYIEKHYKEQLSQSEIAEKFYFSGGYFSRYFHKAMNMTFVEYVARYRNMQARNLLIMTDMSVMDIALECGFSDSRRFIISFKKQYGITPLQYRKVENMSKNGNF